MNKITSFLRRLLAHRALHVALVVAAGAVVGVVGARVLAGHGAGDPPQARATAGGVQPEGGLVQVADLRAEHPDYIIDIPNVDFAGLSESQKEEAIRLLNERRCNCNCNMTLARCRVDDRTCPRSPEIIARFLSLIRTGTAPAEAASQMYGEQGAAPSARTAAALAAASGKVVVYNVEAGDSPSIGPKDAPVTIIEFLDFQCPFCSRAEVTVQRIMREYPDKVRLVFKQHPLVAIHRQAMLASEAALAAHDQGRYREMHDKLFTISRELTRENILKVGRDIGLNMDKFTADLDSGKYRATVESEIQQALSVGASGTPAFFINGRYLSGARPFEQFKPIVEQEINGKRPEFVVGTNVKRDEPRTASKPQRPPEDPNKIYKVDLTGAASQGPENAPVIIVEFTDFQCPYCKRVQPTLQQVLKEYPDEVRLVTKNLPLAFHADARGAARAALAANRQGKYWEFRELIFNNPRALSEDDLLAHAKTLDLDIDRFRSDMNSSEIDQMISKDMKEAQEVGATGTPTFLINGRKMVGAQPLSAFKQRIDAELSRDSK
ncbi:MAG: thioredoxin domain-containing protein [Acidobacteriota bacterium]